MAFLPHWPSGNPRKNKVAQNKGTTKVIRRKTVEKNKQQNKDTQREHRVYPIFGLT